MLCAGVLVLGLPFTSDAATLRVPADVATIQGAIDAANPGDTIVVSPGVYLERIDFRGKAIVVESEHGPDVTIIDAARTGSVATFRTGETRAAMLRGFTLRGGQTVHTGGGVQISSASPTIAGNVITDNRSCTGVGIHSSFGSPRIEGNRVVRNRVEGCTGGWGTGIYIGGDSAAEIVGNEIAENDGNGATTGGGLALFAAGRALVQGNVIARNVTEGPGGCGWGGGIATANFSQARIVGNLIVGNRACIAAGIEWGGSTGTNLFVNNTIADNVASIRYSGVVVSGFDGRNQLHNNVISVASGPAFVCENAATLSQPVLNANDIYSQFDPAYGGTCADQTGINGNLSADPQFNDASTGDYRLALHSPLIDAGNNAAPSLPLTDLAGNPRIVGANGGPDRIDIGAYESLNLPPVVDAGADRTVTAGADCLAAVTLQGSAWDPEGDPLTYTWSGTFGSASGTTPTVWLSAGVYLITLTVHDGNGGSASDSVLVTVRDATAPSIASATASPSVLSKANHELVPVTVTVSAADTCGGSVNCSITSVTSNEPDGGAPGDVSPDWVITGPLTVMLRAERAAKGTGRIYTITVRCTDAAGNSATRNVTVTVPRR